MKYILNKEGPYFFNNSNTSTNIFDSSVSNKPGVYFWTIKYKSSFLINYIGITTVSFKDRFTQHLEYLYSGKSTIYDTDKFLMGIKEPIYRPTGNIKSFMQNYRNLSVAIDDFTKAFIFFLFPLNESKVNLEIIESILISNIKQKNGLPSSFLDNERISRKLLPATNNIYIKLNYEFIGLDLEIIA